MIFLELISEFKHSYTASNIVVTQLTYFYKNFILYVTTAFTRIYLFETFDNSIFM